MPASPPPTDADELEQIAAEFLCEQGEAVYSDNCDQSFDKTNAALADALVTEWGCRVGKLDFARLVDAFGRLRSERKFDGPKQDRNCFGPLLSNEGASPHHPRTN